MISQLQSIRAFVDKRFSDLVLWPQCTGKGDADRASAIIPIKDRRYRIEATSAWVDPSLGKVTLTDLEDQNVVSGPRLDATWDEIERYVRRRMNDAPAPQQLMGDGFILAREPEPAVIAYPDDRAPYLGQGVTYICERGSPIGGMTELAAMVTEIISPTMIAVTVFPKTGEQFWRNDLPRRHEGREFNCWDFSQSLDDLGRLELIVGYRPVAESSSAPARTKKKRAA